MIIVTNNPMVRDYYKDEKNIEMEFIDKLGYMDVLIRVRDYIHKGKILLTHPLSGSVKPNETPFKSIAIDDKALHDIDSLWLIENAIATYLKFEKNRGLPTWSERIQQDFMVVDFDIFRNGLKMKI